MGVTDPMEYKWNKERCYIPLIGSKMRINSKRRQVLEKVVRVRAEQDKYFVEF